jgi:hypothetical protein
MPIRRGPHFVPAHDRQRNARCEYGGQQRDYDRGPIIEDLYRKTIGQHPDIVHCPDTKAHGSGATHKPNQSSRSPRGGHTSSEIKRGIGSQHRDRHRQGD